MRTLMGLAAGCVLAACGHATPTGSYANNWNTPTGNATATRPNYVDPNQNPPQAVGPRDNQPYEPPVAPEQGLPPPSP